MTLRLTSHARQRARERSGLIPDTSHAVWLPASTVRSLRGIKSARRVKGGARYYATAGVVMVARRDSVVTCLRLDLDDLAEMLVRLLFHDSTGGAR